MKRATGVLSILLMSACPFQHTAHAFADSQASNRPDAAIARKLGVAPTILKKYETIDFKFTGGAFVDEPVACGIMRPKNTPKPSLGSERYSLIVWIAGIGPEELDPNSQIGQLRWLDRTIYLDKKFAEDNPYFVLAMQCNPKKGRWFDVHADPPSGADLGDEQLTVLHELIKHVLSTEPIDPDRIYLMGVSAGGTACFEMVLRYPEMFAAVVPMSSLGGDNLRLHRIVDVPIWAFHSEGDAPERAQRTITELNNVGGTAHLTLIEGSGHLCWVPAFRDHDILPWLMSQRRGSFSYPPGIAPLTWWNWTVIGAAIIGTTGYFLRKIRQRQTK